jgi:asparagine synthase (glutamine-hydrolysing)
MCGICGIFFCDRDRHVEPSVLGQMNRRLVHRGPDEEGILVDKNIGLAMRRLSIIDVPAGHQPMANENRDIWIVFNGEIYNHADVRRELESKGHRYSTRSDTESILHLYEEYGKACVQRLRGMFAFVIWDSRRRVLFAARDRLGIKPFYYRWQGKAFLFASEIKAILACPEVEAGFNRAALAEYLAFGYLTGPNTMFSGIQKLMPGHILEVTEEGWLQTERYWDLVTAVDPEPRPCENYVSTYREMLENAVKSHLMSDVPLGIFLSGGLDSSAIAALATKARGAQIKTFAVGYGSVDTREETFSELAYAREVANHIQSDHHEVHLSREEFFGKLPLLVWHEDEPVVWPSSVSLFTVAKLARQHVTVVLTGEGSDETLGGYTRYAWTLLNARMDSAYRSFTTSGIRRVVAKAIEFGPLGASLHRKLSHTFLVRNGNSWPSFYYDNFFSAFSESEQNELLTPDVLAPPGKAYSGSMAVWERGQGELLHRMLYADINSYLIELLMKQDQMSMAASIESRVPFLDHELVQFAMKIPAQYSFRGLAGKFVLKKAVEDLLPNSVIYRKKMGFPTPWQHWLAGPQLDGLERMLLAPRSIDRGLFRQQAVQRIFAEHRNRTRDHSNRIWRLLTFEIWQRIFLDSEPPETIRYDA